AMQVDTRARGFSYSYDAPLDMRMDPAQSLSARELIAEWDERRLAQALRDFGEERHAGAIARAIVRRRHRAPIRTTLELVDTISSAIPAPARFAAGHPAKRSFQALRIAVNDELGQLARAPPRRACARRGSSASGGGWPHDAAGGGRRRSGGAPAAGRRTGAQAHCARATEARLGAGPAVAEDEAVALGPAAADRRPRAG